MNLINMIKSNVAIGEIKKLDPEGEADKVGDLIDKICDDSLGNNSEKLQDVLCDYAERFTKQLIKRLKSDR